MKPGIEMRDRAFHARNGRHKFDFVPAGAVRSHGRGTRRLIANRERWESDEPLLAVRFFVGLNVGDRPYWSTQHVIDLVKEIRREQRGDDYAASFVSQKGFYTHEHGDDVVEEDSMQIIIMNTGGQPRKEFIGEMMQLGEKLAHELEQEEVIVEVQSGGVVERTIGVGA